MALYDEIIAALPELAEKPQEFAIDGSIRLQDDSDDLGAYISKWEYSKPIPKGFKLGK
jgi:hypothetical protein